MAAMADNWRVRETINQVLLAFALRARNAIANPAGRNGFPLPLRPGHTIVPKLDKWCDTLAGLSEDMPSAKRQFTRYCDGIVQDLGGRPDAVARILREPPWTIGEVVEWWIGAGLAIAACRSDPSDSSVEPILGEAILRLQVDDDETHPAIWCAELAHSWRLDPARPSSLERLESWARDAKNLDDCLEELLAWCGDPSREQACLDGKQSDPRVMDEWAADYAHRHHAFAREALRLLRRRCGFEAGSHPTPSSLGHWRRTEVPHSPSERQILRRPLMTAAAADDPRAPDSAAAPARLLAAGWIVEPWPATVMGGYALDTASLPARPASLERAIDAAAQATRPDDRCFAALILPELDGADWPESDRLADGVERLAAIARLGAIETILLHDAASDRGMQSDEHTPRPSSTGSRLADSLMLEGFAFDWLAGGSSVRRIPLSACAAAIAAGAMRIGLLRPAAGETVEIGVVGRPARCPDDLLAAIEAFDWWWWALDTVRIGIAATTAPAAAWLGRAAAPFDWESIKQGLLDLDADAVDAPRTLAASFAALHEAALALNSPESEAGKRGTALRSRLNDLLSQLANTVLRLLLRVDPAAQGGLFPPRTPEGLVDLAAWASGGCAADPRASRWSVRWVRSDELFGRHLTESRPDKDRCEAVFSAGESATDADLAILDDLGVVAGESLPWDPIWEPIRRSVVDGLGERRPPEFGVAVEQARKAWSTGSSRAFDELIKGALAGHPKAVATLRILIADPRLAFECHPTIVWHEDRVSIRSAAVDDPLGWLDSDEAPDGADVHVHFAVDRSKALRILSRGRPSEPSAEAHAARLESAVAGGTIGAREAARAVRAATDRRRMFGPQAPDPLSSVVQAADSLAATGPDAAWADAAFAAIGECCAAHGGRINPADWSAAEGASAEGLGITRCAFHAFVPQGRLVVERFGATAADGSVIASPEGFVSAGKEPDYYPEVLEAVGGFTDQDGPPARLRRNVLEFPRRVVNGQTRTAIQGLFDLAWEVHLSAVDRADFEAAVRAVERLVERSFGMVVFRPKSLGEFPDAWLRTTEGGSPRNNRLTLVRPGVRTRDNLLVCPAIVGKE
jgi:hypothetical protein